MKPSKIQKNVIKLINTKEDGMVSSEISRTLEINRHTLAKHLQILDEKGILKHRKIGMAKLWSLNKSPLESLESEKAESSLKTIFNEIISKMTSPIVVIDKEYTIIYMNKTAREIFENRTGQKCYKAILNKEKPCKKFCVVREFLKKGAEKQKKHITKIKDKTFEFTGFTIRNPDNSLSAVEVGVDITKRKQLENEIKKIKKVFKN